MFQPNELIRQSVTRILQDGPRRFDYILRQCHSLFPDMLHDTLTVMSKEQSVLYRQGKYSLPALHLKRWNSLKDEWEKRIDNAESVRSKISSKIHLPHPLDYEWWFSPSSYKVLARKIIFENPLPVPNSIAFLGAPTLGAYISQLIPDATIHILDKSSNTLRVISECIPAKRLKNVSLTCYDAENPLPSELIGIVQMVVCDPPWYVDYYDAFFRRCALLTQGNIASVAISLFPLFLRPDLPFERNDLLGAASRSRLILTRLEPTVTRYAIPTFEKQALKSKTIRGSNWQRGDLATFVSNGEGVFDNSLIRLEADEWKTVTINQVKVKVRVKTDESISKYVAPAITLCHDEKTILRAVSRRNPHRAEVDVWTSTHLRLQVRGWKAMWRILEGLARELSQPDILASIRSDYVEAVEFPDDFETNVQKTSKELRELLCKT